MSIYVTWRETINVKVLFSKRKEIPQSGRNSRFEKIYGGKVSIILDDKTAFLEKWYIFTI